MKWGRRRPTDGSGEPGTGGQNEAEETGTADPAVGPFDVAEVESGAAGEGFVDLGSLLVRPVEGLDFRLQIDDETGTVLSVVLAGPDGMVEFRAFAAPRGEDLWGQTRPEIAADVARRGGTATEQEGPFGSELYCELPVTGPAGESMVQPSRVIGYTGERWLLRATIAGVPARDAEAAALFEEAVRGVAVRRGTEAMPPGEALPLRLPPDAQMSPAP